MPGGLQGRPNRRGQVGGCQWNCYYSGKLLCRKCLAKKGGEMMKFVREPNKNGRRVGRSKFFLQQNPFINLILLLAAHTRSQFAKSSLSFQRKLKVAAFLHICLNRHRKRILTNLPLVVSFSLNHLNCKKNLNSALADKNTKMR